MRHRRPALSRLNRPEDRFEARKGAAIALFAAFAVGLALAALSCNHAAAKREVAAAEATHTETPTPDATATPIDPASSKPQRIMVIGDSLGMALDPGLTDVGRQWNFSILNRGGLFCGFLPADMMIDMTGQLSIDHEQQCQQWRNSWAWDALHYQPDMVLMIFGGWDYPDHIVNGVTLRTGTPEWKNYVVDHIQDVLDKVVPPNAKLIILTWPYPRPNLWLMLSDGGARAEADARWRDDQLNALYRQFAEANPTRVSLIDLASFICPNGKFEDLYMNGVRMRYDGVHFTPEASYIVANWLAPQIAAAADGVLFPKPSGPQPTVSDTP